MNQRATIREAKPIPRRGLSREEAAMYVGVSATKFDEMRVDGRMPRPKQIDGRKVWDVRRWTSLLRPCPMKMVEVQHGPTHDQNPLEVIRISRRR